MVLYDGLFEHVDIYGKEDHTLLSTVLQTLPIRAIRCVHYGILSYLKCYVPELKFRIDYQSVHPLIQRFIHYIDLYDQKSDYIIIGPKSMYKQYILPSAMWFVVKKKNIGIYHKTDDGVVRVFASCHALPEEIKMYKTKFNNHTFIPITTKVI
jgi:hypothetical protein